MKKIKVFTIDDSPLYRHVLREVIESDKELEYCGYASGGLIALKKLELIKPDIITLDIEMPGMNGISTLKEIMERFPVPVIMVSSFAKEGADVTLRALEIGAVDFVEKPGNESIEENIAYIEEKLLSKIKFFADFKLCKNKTFRQEVSDDEMPIFEGLPSYDIPKVRNKSIDLICIGSSTGGTIALNKILSGIKRNLGVPILIVQHMPSLYTKSFAERLNSVCPLEVVEAENGQKILKNRVYVAKGGVHMRVNQDKILLEDSSAINSHKPSVDVMFKSASEYYKDGIMAIILTGMGHDGAIGITKVKDAGGFTVAQDEESCVIFGMPRSAINTGKIDRVIPLDRISTFINETIDYTNK